MSLHHFLGALMLFFALLANPLNARASEQIPLDPNAPPRPPARTLSAIVVEETTSRRCSVLLMPNGVVTLARPCDLEARLDAVRRWRRCGDNIKFLGAGPSSLLVFMPAGARRYKTEGHGPSQLTLILLPEVSTPLSQ